MEQKDICKLFSDTLWMCCIEDKLRDLYVKEFNVDPDDTGESKFTPEEQIERYAKNVAFWLNMLNQHITEVKTNSNYDEIDKLELFMIQHKLGCIKQRADSRLKCDKEVYNKYLMRLKELIL